MPKAPFYSWQPYSLHYWECSRNVWRWLSILMLLFCITVNGKEEAGRDMVSCWPLFFYSHCFISSVYADLTEQLIDPFLSPEFSSGIFSNTNTKYILYFCLLWRNKGTETKYLSILFSVGELYHYLPCHPSQKSRNYPTIFLLLSIPRYKSSPIWYSVCS